MFFTCFTSQISTIPHSRYWQMRSSVSVLTFSPLLSIATEAADMPASRIYHLRHVR